jgi:hypothetical protein
MLHLYEFEGVFECDRAIVLASNQTTAEHLLHAASFGSWRKVWCIGTVDAEDATQRILLMIDASNIADGDVTIRDDQGKVEMPDWEAV